MNDNPRIVARREQHYVAIAANVAGESLRGQFETIYPLLFAWLSEHGITPTGQPFIRSPDREGGCAMTEIGVPVELGAAGDGRVTTGSLPRGRYLSILHRGAPSDLDAAEERLHGYARQRSLVLAGATDAGASQVRLEIYHTDPADDRGPSESITEIAYRLSD